MTAEKQRPDNTPLDRPTRELIKQMQNDRLPYQSEHAAIKMVLEENRKKRRNKQAQKQE